MPSKLPWKVSYELYVHVYTCVYSDVRAAHIACLYMNTFCYQHAVASLFEVQ